MTKQEFDRIGENMGYGPCADYMWDEAERMYCTIPNMDKTLAVYIYWNEPGIYRQILRIREDVNVAASCICARDGYQFLDTMEQVSKLSRLERELNDVKIEAQARYAKFLKTRKAA